jgi:hypothetical protein
LRDLGADVLFMDVDSIPIGKNFAKVLHDEVAQCEVLLAVIGRNWLDARDEHGKRRLDNPNDFVRIEISAALQRDIPVVPILLEGVRIPDADQLPKELEELSLRNAIEVRHTSFHSDVDRLIRGLKKELDVAPMATETECASAPRGEYATRVTPEAKPAVFAAVGNPAQELNDQSNVGIAATEINRLLKVGPGHEPILLAVVGAVGGLLAIALILAFTIPTDLERYVVGALSVSCGVAAGILSSRYGPFIAVHVASIAWSLMLIAVLLVEILAFGTRPAVSVDDALRLIELIFTFAGSVFATLVFYEWVCIPFFKRTMKRRMAS